MANQVEDLMATSIATITPDLTVEHVRFTMRTHRIQALPVVDPDGKPIGIVSASDLLEHLEHGALVRQVMTRRLITVHRTASVEEAARLMLEKRIHHLLVTDDDDRMVGLVSTFDLLKLSLG